MRCPPCEAGPVGGLNGLDVIDGERPPEMEPRGPVGTGLGAWGVAGEAGGGAKREDVADHPPRPPRGAKPPPPPPPPRAGGI